MSSSEALHIKISGQTNYTVVKSNIQPSPQVFVQVSTTMTLFTAVPNASTSTSSVHPDPHRPNTATHMSMPALGDFRPENRDIDNEASLIKFCQKIHMYFQSLLRVLRTTFSSFFALGIHKVLRRFLAYRNVIAEQNSDLEAQLPNSPERLISSESDQWHSIITEKLVSQWKASCNGCVLILYLSLGLLQIGDIYGNIYARTSVLSAFICAGIGLITGVMFLYSDGYLKTNVFRKRWVRASQDSDTTHTSVNDFWPCLSIPISLLAWSILYFIITIVIIICVIDNPILRTDDINRAGTSSDSTLPQIIRRNMVTDRPDVSGIYSHDL